MWGMASHADQLTAELLRELRELRRGEGALRPERMAGCEALVAHVGMGSVQQAYATLVEMIRRFAGEVDGDVRAYLETSGLGIEGASLNDRLQAYADLHFVDPRTALRRSDRGAVELAALLRDEVLFTRPIGILALYQAGDRVNVTLSLNIDPDSPYRPPVAWVNGKDLGQLEMEFGEERLRNGYVRARHVLDAEMQREAEWLFKIELAWVMPVWPQWVLAAQLADNRLVAKVQSQRNFTVEVTITWGAWPGGEIDREAGFGEFPLLGVAPNA